VSVIANAGFDLGVRGSPAFQYITNITNDVQATITTAANHDYSLGEIVTFKVGKDHGMVEINNQSATILEISLNTLKVAINTSFYTSFINAGIYTQYPALVVPSASGIIPNQFVPTVNLEDAFTMVKT